MGEIVFLNGKFIPKRQAKVVVSEPGFLYGWGLFESMRSYNKKIVYFDEHLLRIKESTRLLDIKFGYALADLKKIIRKSVEINRLRDAYVRLSIWKCTEGVDILVTAKEYRPYPLWKYSQGVHACISSFRQNGDYLLAQLKTANYLLFRLAYAQAKVKGFDEAIILNHQGYITEASRSNLFFVKDKELFTPALGCACLDGITRRAIFDLAEKYNIKIYEGNFTILDLCSSDEAFLTNSLMGIMPLSAVEEERIGRCINPYKLTHFLREKYKSLLRNEA